MRMDWLINPRLAVLVDVVIAHGKVIGEEVRSARKESDGDLSGTRGRRSSVRGVEQSLTIYP
jgi:hypothetical protein